MDGNNRWSIKNNHNKYTTYKKGALNLINLTNFIFENFDSKYVSAFALSKYNLNRSKNLISILKKILLEFLNDMIDNNENINFNIKFIGEKNFLNSKIINKINNLEKLKKNNGKFLIIFINYSGKDDIKQASYKYNLKNKNSKFENFLSTKNIPDPDILIRTGGFSRLSDFMIYQSSFTELFFTKKLWPDLKNNDLSKIFHKYLNTERKFGL